MMAFKNLRQQRKVMSLYNNKYSALKPRKNFPVEHFPVEQSIIIPSTYDVDKKVDKKTFNKRVDHVEKYLSNLFGGYTSVDTKGGFVDENKRLVREPSVKVTSFAKKSAYDKNIKDLFTEIDKWCKNWKQESIGYEYEGDLYYIPPQPNKEE